MSAPLTTAPAGGISLYEPRAPEALGRPPWTEIDWRAHQRWAILDGERVNTIELGAGPPLLFVHGLSGRWANWLGQLSVLGGSATGESGAPRPAYEGPDGLAPSRPARRAPRPSPGHRLLALDLPGFGDSPLPESGVVSIAGYARLLERLLDEREIESATLIGNSMGGLIAAELALASPRRVERLVLVSPAGVSTHGYRGSARAASTLRRLEPIVASRAAWVAANADLVAARPRLRTGFLKLVVRHPEHLPAALAAEQLRGAGKPGFVGALESMQGYELRSRLREIACPSLIVWGEGDHVISARDAEVFAVLIPSSRKVIFADTGHMAMLERPAAFNALLTDFLSG
jgi:pimeloyl-ACP methyl ester carboxylesterase